MLKDGIQDLDIFYFLLLLLSWQKLLSFAGVLISGGEYSKVRVVGLWHAWIYRRIFCESWFPDASNLGKCITVDAKQGFTFNWHPTTQDLDRFLLSHPKHKRLTILDKGVQCRSIRPLLPLTKKKRSTIILPWAPQTIPIVRIPNPFLISALLKMGSEINFGNIPVLAI